MYYFFTYICSQIIIKQKDMINATELRIGNYVSTPNQKYFRIDLFDYVSKGIGKFGQISDKDLHPLTWYLQDLKPIPLTEEILLKCGFKKSRNIGCYDTDKDAFFFESDKINLTIDFILSSSNHYYQSNPVDGAIPLKYLHQLQNLVFSVTGQELEINL